MNKNVVLGIIAFFVWSVFGTWYYVTNIKNLDDEISTAEANPKASELPIDSIANQVVEVKEEPPAALDIEKVFTFKKDSKALNNPEQFAGFLDSMNAVINERKLNVLLVGHTCDLGSEKYNLKLGQERADALKVQFQKVIRNAEINIMSKGENEPYAPNTSEANRKLNRRVTINLTTNK